jgi:hypothetical protein
MVLSGSKKTTYRSSIVNQAQGGGEKKAGLPSSIGKTSWINVYYHESGDGLLNAANMQKNRFKVFPNMNLPVGFDRRIRMH